MAFVRTEDTATERQLRDLFDMDPDDEMQTCVGVCSGEWRQEGDVWRFFTDPEWEGDWP